MIFNNEQTFIENNMNVFKAFNESNMIALGKTQITGKSGTPVGFGETLPFYSKTLITLLEDYNGHTVSSSALNEITNIINKGMIDGKEITTEGLLPIDVISINPEYLRAYIDKCYNVLNEAIGSTSVNPISLTYKANLEADICKRRAVATTIQHASTKDLKFLPTETPRPMVVLSNEYLAKNVVPFIRDYEVTKSKITKQTLALITILKEIETRLPVMLSVAYSRAKTTEERYFGYEVMHAMLDVIAYITYMATRRLNHFNSNTLTVNRIHMICNNMEGVATESGVSYSTIHSVTPDVISQELMGGDANALTDIANRIYEYHAHMPGFTLNKEADDFVDFAIDDSGNKTNLYSEIRKAYQFITAGCNLIASELEEEFLVAHEIIGKAGFDSQLMEKWKHISEQIPFPKASGYSDKDYISILSELKHFENNMNWIVKAIADAKESIIILKSRLAKNINGEFSDPQTLAELQTNLNVVSDQFETITEEFAEKLLQRLFDMGTALTDMADTKNGVDYGDIHPFESMGSTEYFDDSYEDTMYLETVGMLEEAITNHFKDLQIQYICALEGVNRSDIVLEADDANSNNGGNNSTQTNNTPNNNNNTSNKPSVVNNTSTATNNASGKGFKGIIEAIKKLISGVLDGFMTASGGFATKVNNFLTTHKQTLIGLDYSSSQINAIAYGSKFNVDGIVDLYNSAEQILNQMQPQALQSGTDFENCGSVLSKVFPKLSGVTVNDDKLKDTLTPAVINYFDTGNTGTKAQRENIQDKNAFVKNEAIPFLESYADPNGNRKTVTDAEKKVMEALTKLIERCDTTGPSTGAQPVTASADVNVAGNVFTEADNQANGNQPAGNNQTTQTQAPNTNGAMEPKINKIKAVVLNICNEGHLAIKRRAEEYMNILQPFAPKGQSAAQQQPQAGQPQQPVQQPQQ